MYPWESYYKPKEFANSKSAKIIYPNTIQLLSTIAMDRFEWSGKDKAGDDITSEQVERILMTGAAVLRKIDGIIYPLVPKPKFDSQGRVSEGYAMLVNRQQIPVSVDEGDIFYWGTDVYSLINEYAIRLTKLSQTVDINIVTSRMQYLMIGDGSNEEEMIQLAQSIQDADRIASIALSASVDPNEVIVTSGSNLITDKLLEAKTGILSNFAQSLGIHLNATEKRERLIVDEVHSGEDLACMIYRRELSKRKKFADAAGWTVKACYDYAGGERQNENGGENNAELD